MLPLAPWPDLEVPEPLILGTLATALPVPQDRDEVFMPARYSIPWACLVFLETLSWTKVTISCLRGAPKTDGSLISLALCLALECAKTETIGLADIVDFIKNGFGILHN